MYYFKYIKYENMKIQVSEEFCSAHFLLGHSKCGRIHGHNWKLTVIIEGKKNSEGMIVDFSVLKAGVRKILSKYDHKILLPSMLEKEVFGKEVKFFFDSKKYVFPLEDCVFIDVKNTTCEELAGVFYNEIKNFVSCDGISIIVEEKKGQGAVYP